MQLFAPPPATSSQEPRSGQSVSSLHSCRQRPATPQSGSPAGHALRSEQMALSAQSATLPGVPHSEPMSPAPQPATVRAKAKRAKLTLEGRWLIRAGYNESKKPARCAVISGYPRAMRRTFFIPLASLLLLAACDDASTPTDSGRSDSGIVCADCGIDSGPRPPDAGMDAGPPDDAGGPVDAFVPSSDAAEGAPCGFNRDCSATQRCECDVATGCFCMTGVRGTGQVGVDTCTDSNDCASALCVEGPVDGTFYCSDECTGDGDCAGQLPRCIDIAFVGTVCARIPPDAGT